MSWAYWWGGWCAVLDVLMNLNGEQVSGKQCPRWTDGIEELWLATTRDGLSCREDGVLSSQPV